MISHKMLGLIIAVIGFAFVVTGTIMFLMEPLQPVQNTFCGFCMTKHPIYCYKTLHGLLFDLGWLLVMIGSVVMLFYRKEKLRQ